MSVSISQADRTSSAYTAADLDFVLDLHIKQTRRLAAAITAVRYEGKSLTEACGIGDLEGLRAEFEWSLLGFREGAAHAATGREVSYGDVPALVAAIRELTDEMEIAAGRRPCNPLATAMRRVDAIEAAERSLIDMRHDVVADIAASLPPYDAGAVAPCADLARAAEDHPYGKCGTGLPATTRSHGAYEAGFHPSSAA